MPVNVSNRTTASATESVQGHTASGPQIGISHQFNVNNSSESYQNIYSRSLTTALGYPVTDAGTVFALASLTYPTRSGTIDMFASQRLSLLVVQNAGTNPATLTLENATVPIANGTFKLPAGMVLTLQSLTELFLSEQIHAIRVIADTAATTTDVEILFASKSTA